MYKTQLSNIYKLCSYHITSHTSSCHQSHHYTYAHYSHINVMPIGSSSFSHNQVFKYVHAHHPNSNLSLLSQHLSLSCIKLFTITDLCSSSCQSYPNEAIILSLSCQTMSKSLHIYNLLNLINTSRSSKTSVQIVSSSSHLGFMLMSFLLKSNFIYHWFGPSQTSQLPQSSNFSYAKMNWLHELFAQLIRIIKTYCSDCHLLLRLYISLTPKEKLRTTPLNSKNYQNFCCCYC